MKYVLVIALALLAGCSSVPSTYKRQDSSSICAHEVYCEHISGKAYNQMQDLGTLPLEDR